jgi:hypothetical protein
MEISSFGSLPDKLIAEVKEEIYVSIGSAETPETTEEWMNRGS